MNNFDTFYDMMQDKSREIRELREEFMSCTSDAEINQVRDANLEFMNEHPESYNMIRLARRRVAKLRREAKKSWGHLMN